MPPAGSGELSFLSIHASTLYAVHCPGEDGGKTTHDMLHWVATTGEKGSVDQKRQGGDRGMTLYGLAERTSQL